MGGREFCLKSSREKQYAKVANITLTFKDRLWPGELIECNSRKKDVIWTMNCTQIKNSLLEPQNGKLAIKHFQVENKKWKIKNDYGKCINWSIRNKIFWTWSRLDRPVLTVEPNLGPTGRGSWIKPGILVRIRNLIYKVFDHHIPWSLGPYVGFYIKFFKNLIS